MLGEDTTHREKLASIKLNTIIQWFDASSMTLTPSLTKEMLWTKTMSHWSTLVGPEKSMTAAVMQFFYQHQEDTKARLVPTFLSDFKNQSERSKRIIWMKMLMGRIFCVSDRSSYQGTWSIEQNQDALQQGFSVYSQRARAILSQKDVAFSAVFTPKQQKELLELTDELAEIGGVRAGKMSFTALALLKTQLTQKLADYYQPGFFTRLTRNNSRLNLAKKLSENLHNISNAGMNPYKAFLTEIQKVKRDILAKDREEGAGRRLFSLHKNGVSQLYKTLNEVQDAVYQAWAEDEESIQSLSYREQKEGDLRAYCKEFQQGLFSSSRSNKKKTVGEDVFAKIRAVDVDCMDLTELQKVFLELAKPGLLKQLPGYLQACAQEIMAIEPIEKKRLFNPR